jgi:hypothetical protein
VNPQSARLKEETSRLACTFAAISQASMGFVFAKSKSSKGFMVFWKDSSEGISNLLPVPNKIPEKFYWL